jgi:arsenate reductase
LAKPAEKSQAVEKRQMNILVLCTGNSARSILLESILCYGSAGRISAFSAGSNPVGRVTPAALAQLDSVGLPTNGYRSKSWDAFSQADAPIMDIVITVCGSARDTACPIWRGAPISVHWGVDDPAAVTHPDGAVRDAFSVAYTVLQKRAQALFTLPFESMAAVDLKRELVRIGGIS